MDDEALRKELAIAWEYTHLHEDWVAPLDETLAELTAEDALNKPKGGERCIWEIVLHMAAWNEDIVARMRSGNREHPHEGAWPPLPTNPDRAAWEDAKARLRNSIELVAEALRTMPMDRILKLHYGLGDFLCRYIHMGYHIGQITKLRECLRV